ncbi:MAG: cysteine--tRNA ligase [Alphaproteobacteria bacterium]|nr:cysteine--tRNA ligase [Alphaproteobacteria bacterium]
MLKFYNTRTRSVDSFKSLEGNTVRMYCCGPTVYNYAHIGNLRTYIFEDLLYKTLKRAGYDIIHEMNVTDVGHLTSDGDEGEDKMLKGAEREHKSVLEIARKYEDAFFTDTKALNIRRPDIVCRATEYVQDMIAFVQKLEEKGYAYVSGGNVYFDTAKFKTYGDFAHLDLENLRHGARVDTDDQKRNPTDFVLWFTQSKFENQILTWDSPWGKGYPGWHIECSTMAMKNLGDTLDIHCGGIDHIPVHHTNEIAQSEALLGHRWVNFWLHGEFLTLKNEKMSKSSGEFFTLSLLEKKGYSPLHYRYLCLTAHYRSQLVFSYENMDSAKATYENLKSKILELKKAKDTPLATDEEKSKAYLDEFNGYLFNDLGTPQALTIIYAVLKDKDLSSAAKLKLIEDFDTVLGLSVSEFKEEKLNVPKDIIALAEKRVQARANKDFAQSDALRDEINALGFEIKDMPQGKYEISRK